MIIEFKVKTLDARTHQFSVDNEITVRQFKDLVAVSTNINAEQQRLIYCGRVLSDERQLKDYDVHGKVLHVAERPPPSARTTSASSSGDSSAPRDRGAHQNRSGMRNSPLFRALDSMVVGTMAIPMNANMAQPHPLNANHAFPSSPSFCMNRITVARHMIECANNIAAYLEDPTRGLNNTSLDILARGRWTMESTVVEVGISAPDLPQNPNFVEMVHGAVSAALRSNSPNVTVVQLPTLYRAAAPANNTMPATASAGSQTDESPPPSASTVTIEDLPEDERDDAASNPEGDNAVPIVTEPDQEEFSDAQGRRVTSTRVLAEVMQELRRVQTRLEPFMLEFLDLLYNDPVFDENDTTARENAQRLFDRISEAIHYMSHAQHSISDLMLDFSSPVPRHLTCRPILVEQSGYVSSNNYMSSNAANAAVAAAMRNGVRSEPQQSEQRMQSEEPTSAASPAPAAASSAAVGNEATSSNTAVASAVAAQPQTAATDANAPAVSIIEDPVDDPPLPAAVFAAANATLNANVDDSIDNPQMNMARLIQAVVQSTPLDSELHLQINAPNILSFGMPLNGRQAIQVFQTPGPSRAPNNNGNEIANGVAGEGSAAATVAADDAGGNGDNGGGGGGNREHQARVTTATLPTTSTQTRSTSRPQLQIGSLPTTTWNGRFVPSQTLAAFDRFLSCNSHHIRELEPDQTEDGDNPQGPVTAPTPTRNMRNRSNNMETADGAIPRMIVYPQPIDVNAEAARHYFGSYREPRQAFQRVPRLPNPILRFPRQIRVNAEPHGRFGRMFLSSVRPRNRAPRVHNEGVVNVESEVYAVNVLTQLRNFFVSVVFNNGVIRESTIPAAQIRVERWFDEFALAMLPQYEKREYNARNSVLNLLRHSFPLLARNFQTFSLYNALSIQQDVRSIMAQLMRRLFMVLTVCTGRTHAELFWGQLMRSMMVPLRSYFRGEALQFLCLYIDPMAIPAHTDFSEVQQFIVRRDGFEPPTPMDTDADVMVDAASSASSDTITLDTETEESPADVLPDVVVGAEPWHGSFPAEWLPTITRDLQTQAEQPQQQEPFSDAYISGMSVKRRKLLQANKARSTDVPALIASNVQRAIQNVGVTTSTASNQPFAADEITNAIASDPAMQASYTEALRSAVRERLRDNPDYSPEKYPQMAKFVNNDK